MCWDDNKSEIAADKEWNQNDMNMLPIGVSTAPNAH